MIEKRAFSIGEAAVMLAVAASTIRAAIERGEISSFRVGRRVLIPAVVVERLLRERDGASVGVAR